MPSAPARSSALGARSWERLSLCNLANEPIQPAPLSRGALQRVSARLDVGQRGCTSTRQERSWLRLVLLINLVMSLLLVLRVSLYLHIGGMHLLVRSVITKR